MTACANHVLACTSHVLHTMRIPSIEHSDLPCLFVLGQLSALFKKDVLVFHKMFLFCVIAARLPNTILDHVPFYYHSQ